MQNNILIIDNDLKTCKKLKYGLQEKGYYAYYVCIEKEGLRNLFRQQYQMVIMEIIFNNTEKWELLSIIRKFYDIPIFIISSKWNLSDRVAGLNLGADDYLVKPFELEEVYARVDALLRRCIRLSHTEYKKEETTLQSQSIVLDIMYRTAYMKEEEIILTKTEFDLLYFLMLHRDQVITKEQLYVNVWKDHKGDSDNSVMCQIRNLRKKIESDPRHPKYIKSVWGVGYRFQDK